VSAVDTSGVSLFKVLRKAMEKKGVEVRNKISLASKYILIVADDLILNSTVTNWHHS
jgi:hypothetical protein